MTQTPLDPHGAVRDATPDRVTAQPFPKGFLWGAATSAYQIEGGIGADGRGPSVWDTFVRVPGRVEDGSTGAVAADHRHRFAQDVELMAWLGLRAYRFSVAWPRVQPTGRGPANAAGLDFYDRLVDTLCANNIQPVVTLFHWDLPQDLQDSGGWALRDTAGRFADYAVLVFERLRDRVQLWTTINEPRTHAFLGYAAGIHAPGVQSYRDACASVHHQLLGHGWAVAAMRSIDEREFGIALDPAPVTAAGDRPEDHDLARRIDGLVNRLYLDPLLLGRYPADVRVDLAPFLDDTVVRDGDEAAIHAPLGFLGVNYYRPYRVAAGTPKPSPAPSLWPRAEHVRFVESDGPVTDNGWIVDAEGLCELLVAIDRDYPAPPLYVTENGAAYNDDVVAGAVRDERRVRYLHEHLQAAQRALVVGVDLRGYFVWSLLDNFEWERGYTTRFGIVHVDFETLERRPKASAWWYRDVIRANALPAADHG